MLINGPQFTYRLKSPAFRKYRALLSYHRELISGLFSFRLRPCPRQRPLDNALTKNYPEATPRNFERGGKLLPGSNAIF